MIRVAVDAMGGDNAPQAEIAGRAPGARRVSAIFAVQLVGRPDVDRGGAGHASRRRPRAPRDPCRRQTSSAWARSRSPRSASKPNSSIVVGLGLQKAGHADAFVSAGNTGAVLAASTLLLGLHDGVERATVATLFPTADDPVLVLDGGANVDCSARELLCFAYPRHRLHAGHPRARRVRWWDSSTWARRTRRAMPSSRKRTGS